MRGLIRIWALVNLLFPAAFSLPAHAGFVYFSCEAEHLRNFDDAPAELNSWENIEIVGYDKVIVFGETDSDPTFHVTKTVTKSSGVTWTAYEPVLSGPDVAFDYTNTPSSSHFLYTNEQVMKLTFYAPNGVPNGDTVTLDFDVTVAAIGSLGFKADAEPGPRADDNCFTRLRQPGPASQKDQNAM